MEYAFDNKDYKVAWSISTVMGFVKHVVSVLFGYGLFWLFYNCLEANSIVFG